MTIKVRLKELILKGLMATGRYKPFDLGELEGMPGETVEFSGDTPLVAGKENRQHVLKYRVRRSPQEVQNVIYTPQGMAWKDGTLHQKYSLREPSLRELLERPPRRPEVTLSEGVLVQGEHPYTYGDWFGEHLCTIAVALPLSAPVLMPASLMAKHFVRRDLRALGVEPFPVQGTILVRRALVLPKMRPIFYITREEVQALQRALHADPVPPRPGSILYLSREGYRGDHHSVEAHRSYPSEEITRFMRELGATIVPTREATPDQYRELAGEAETVVADHGSALCNLIFWNTSHVIELFNDSWWGNGFLMLAHALGIRDHALVRVNNRTPEQVQQQVVHHMERFGILKSNPKS